MAPDATVIEVTSIALDEHPAARAWREIAPKRSTPLAISILKTKRRSQVYRLEGARSGGLAVIAKRGKLKKLMPEERAYIEILHRLPVPTPTCYGSFQEPNGKYGWLFIEDVGDLEYSASRREHRVAAARWLGCMHTSEAALSANTYLSVGEPCPPVDLLRSTRETVLGQRSRVNRVRDLPAVLERLASLIETAESEWHQVELSSSTLPRTLVHGDFVGKNLRIQPGRLGRDVVVFDWEHARFGNPAADLAQFAEGQAASPDLEAYRLAVRHRWPRLGVAEIEWMAHTGTVFWLLGNVDRACWSLDRGFEETASAELRLYRDGLAQVCGALGWWRGSLV